MERYSKYIIGLIGFVILVLFVVYFSNIIIWILTAALIAMIGSPVVIVLERLKIGKLQFPRWLAALCSLATIILVIILFIQITYPLISNQLSELQNIDVEAISDGLEEPIKRIDEFIQEVPFINQPDFSTENFLIEKITSILNLSSVGDVFADLSALLWNLILSVFAILFISFFFLKDRGLFDKGVLIVVPTKYEEKAKNVLVSVRRLSTRYLIGIILQSLCMMILYIAGLYIIGVDINLAVLIAVIAGILNVIPYIGPWIGAFIALILITVANIQADFFDYTASLLVKMLIVVAIAQLIDNIIFQPLIFSKSVKAHPIEIFFIILIAGSLYGVLGMMLAIPAYTVFRVIAKEFLNQYKFIRKITQNISETEDIKIIEGNDTGI